MGFFNSGLFWFIEGVLACLAVLGLRAWLADKGISMRWWKWLLVIAWMTFAGFTLAFIGTSLGEGEPRAALVGGIIFGVVSLIFGVGLWRLLAGGKPAERETGT
jgi:hypothetical protein